MSPKAPGSDVHPQNRDITPRELEVISKAIRRLFREWNVDPEDQAMLLGQDVNSTAIIQALAESKPLPNDPDIMERVDLLLDIYGCLKLYFHRNPEIRQDWMGARTRAFRDLTPIEHVRMTGLSGLMDISRYLRSLIAR